MKSKQPKKNKAGKSGGKMQPARSDAHADPYRSKSKHVEKKLAEPTVCSTCGAVYREGRWLWPSVRPATGQPTTCPACQRIRDGAPLGEVRIAGAFAAQHRPEIVARVKHVEEREKKDHPLQRLIAVREDGAELLVTTTDPHLAHAIGTALHDAFKGELHAPWAEAGELMRVRWERD
jgi:hypothetical protein